MPPARPGYRGNPVAAFRVRPHPHRANCITVARPHGVVSICAAAVSIEPANIHFRPRSAGWHHAQPVSRSARHQVFPLT
ncbi:hypothetical protein C7S15_8730 [Burkholderia cepacia]|nr:hypothetical protein [Burkholderia cepacia]